LHKLALKVGEEAEVTRDEFFEFARTYATGLDETVAGSAAQVADFLEQEFEATGCRGGFMLAHPIATPRDFLNIVDYLIPELQRRGRFKTRYEGKTLRENLALK